jgi:hypothetical protein
MNETKHGGPAFPSTQYVSGISPTGHSVGMTLRDYFAAKAMQGLSACEEHDMTHEDAAVWAYRRADEMLKAREK